MPNRAAVTAAGLTPRRRPKLCLMQGRRPFRRRRAKPAREPRHAVREVLPAHTQPLAGVPGPSWQEWQQHTSGSRREHSDEDACSAHMSRRLSNVLSPEMRPPATTSSTQGPDRRPPPFGPRRATRLQGMGVPATTTVLRHLIAKASNVLAFQPCEPYR